MGYVLLSSGSNYNFAVVHNTYITTESEEAVEHLRKTLEEKMAENIYTKGNYKLKASPIKVLDALRTIDYSVVSSGGSDGRFIWTLMKLPPITIYPSATPAVPNSTSQLNLPQSSNNLLDPTPPMSPPPISPSPLPVFSQSHSISGQGMVSTTRDSTPVMSRIEHEQDHDLDGCAVSDNCFRTCTMGMFTDGGSGGGGHHHHQHHHHGSGGSNMQHETNASDKDDDFHESIQMVMDRRS